MAPHELRHGGGRVARQQVPGVAHPLHARVRQLAPQPLADGDEVGEVAVTDGDRRAELVRDRGREAAVDAASRATAAGATPTRSCPAAWT